MIMQFRMEGILRDIIYICCLYSIIYVHGGCIKKVTPSWVPKYIISDAFGFKGFYKIHEGGRIILKLFLFHRIKHPFHITL